MQVYTELLMLRSTTREHDTMKDNIWLTKRKIVLCPCFPRERTLNFRFTEKSSRKTGPKCRQTKVGK